MRIELNGESVQLPEGVSVGQVVARVGADPQRRGVAVAVAGEVVPRSAWDQVELRDGDQVEVVGAVQGG